MLQVFICGHQKSGTTLIASLLDNHKDIMVFPEETSFLRWVQCGSFENSQAMLEFQLNKTHVSRLREKSGEDQTSNVLKSVSSFNFEQFEKTLTSRFRNSTGTPKNLLDHLMDCFAKVTGQTQKKLWVEKTPRNECFWEDIKKMYPKAKLLYIYRDPRDVYCSYKKNREQYLGGTGTLKLGVFLKTWTESIINALQIPEDTILFLKYETLTQSPDLVIDRICNFLDIPKTPDLNIPTKLGSPWIGNSMHGDKFKVIDPNTIGRWKTCEWQQDITAIELLLGTIMGNLGYTNLTNRPNWLKGLSTIWNNQGNRKKILSNIIMLRSSGLKLRKRFVYES